MQKISEAVLTFGYVGYLPKVPGTWGTAATVPFLFLIPADWNFVLTTLVAALVLFVIGVRLARNVVTVFGKNDPGPVVLDEVVGMLVAVALSPRPTWPWILAAFVLFRIFDITKPFPVRNVERIPGGLGIFMDDVLAGLYTNALLHLVALVF